MERLEGARFFFSISGRFGIIVRQTHQRVHDAFWFVYNQTMLPIHCPSARFYTRRQSVFFFTLRARTNYADAFSRRPPGNSLRVRPLRRASTASSLVCAHYVVRTPPPSFIKRQAANLPTPRQTN